MRFHLVDQIRSVEPGRKLTAVKFLTLGEEYLADHFPTFPVMPGVLMLQAVVEAGSWLVRVSHDYAHSILVLREVKNAKYGTFMPPGHRMDLTVELVKSEDGPRFTLKGRGELAGQSTVSAQFVLHGYNLRERLPHGAERDERLIRQLQAHYELLRRDG